MYGDKKHSKKRIILTFLSMALMGGPMVAYMYHLSNPTVPLFQPIHILLFICVTVAIGSSIFILDKPDAFKAIVYGVELITVGTVAFYLQMNEVVTVLAFFTGAFWGSIRYLSMDFFETNEESKKLDK